MSGDGKREDGTKLDDTMHGETGHPIRWTVEELLEDPSRSNSYKSREDVQTWRVPLDRLHIADKYKDEQESKIRRALTENDSNKKPRILTGTISIHMLAPDLLHGA